LATTTIKGQPRWVKKKERIVGKVGELERTSNRVGREVQGWPKAGSEGTLLVATNARSDKMAVRKKRELPRSRERIALSRAKIDGAAGARIPRQCALRQTRERGTSRRSAS